MNTYAWTLLTRNQFLGFLREPAASGFNLLVPFFIVLIQAVAYGSNPVDGLPGYRVVDTLPVGAATMFIMIIGIFGMGIGLASMIEARSIAAYRLRPGGTAGIISAYSVVLLALIIVGLAFSTAALAAIWGLKSPVHPLAIIPAIPLCATFFIGLGATSAGLGGSARSAQAVSSALFFPLLFLSGAMFPTDGFPTALQVIAHILPGEHVYNIFVYCWIEGQPFPSISVVYMLVGAVILTWASISFLAKREDI